ncbi:MAG: class I SAM-dependent methyltransferase [Rhodobacteraceae bacterium]|nr:class I SAM-dependent methyltransferase [Alphaproteobacteria bacterium]MBT8477256.1 class I SAM-dependent methyltransferase [Alphaproteobacteria bacterium]NNF72510.1 class I SAM-dependent methyltransferase [Paracoccaceae bacterium]NNK66085.1 class I SAM-dependent methyltransferase [Paracoccaceae bacterium]
MRLDDIVKSLASFRNFTGGPNDRFADVTFATFYSLCILGMTPKSRVLDIGCGALRNGFLLMNYLEKDMYYGVEPNTAMMDEGKDKLAKPFLQDKTPNLSDTDQFDFKGSFGDVVFDFAFARSVFTHTSKSQMDLCFKELAKVSRPGTIFLLSYKPPTGIFGGEYKGKNWIGRSHESSTPGIAHYKKETIVAAGKPHGFRELQGFDHRILQALQEWLVLEKT